LQRLRFPRQEGEQLRAVGQWSAAEPAERIVAVALRGLGGSRGRRGPGRRRTGQEEVRDVLQPTPEGCGRPAAIRLPAVTLVAIHHRLPRVRSRRQDTVTTELKSPYGLGSTSGFDGSASQRPSTT